MRFLKVSDDDLMRFLGVESYERPCLPTTATTTTTTTTTVTTSFEREKHGSVHDAQCLEWIVLIVHAQYISMKLESELNLQQKQTIRKEIKTGSGALQDWRNTQGDHKYVKWPWNDTEQGQEPWQGVSRKGLEQVTWFSLTFSSGRQNCSNFTSF